MNLIKGFDEKIFRTIARYPGSKQLEKDVSFIRIKLYRKDKVYAERLDDVAFFVGYHNPDHFRLVGIGVRKQDQGKGIGRFMLKRALMYAKEQGYTKVRTRTLSAVDFYQKYAGAIIVDMKGDDFIMEMNV